MSAETIILIVGFTFGFYMAWNIGANDVANSMASAVGAKAITIRQAVFIAGILNIVGATFIGSHVTNTIRKGIISTEVMSDPQLALAGALAALLAAALWVSFATWRSLPVSTTHSIVGAMIGFGIMAGGFGMVNWGKLGAVVLSWVISPVFSMVIAFVMFKIIIRLIISRGDPFQRALQYSPYFISTAIFVVVLSFLFKTPLGKKLSLTMPMALMVGIAQALAPVPGVSRSGVTITVALLLDMDRQSAARFSFLLSIPVIASAGLLKLWELLQNDTLVDWTALAIGAVVSGITAYLCIAVFLRFLDRVGLMPFVYYRLLLAAVLYVIWLA